MKEERVFLDKDGNIVKPEKAEWLVVHTYDDKGKLVEEKWVEIKDKA